MFSEVKAHVVKDGEGLEISKERERAKMCYAVMFRRFLGLERPSATIRTNRYITAEGSPATCRHICGSMCTSESSFHIYHFVVG